MPVLIFVYNAVMALSGTSRTVTECCNIFICMLRFSPPCRFYVNTQFSRNYTDGGLGLKTLPSEGEDLSNYSLTGRGGDIKDSKRMR